MNGKGSPHKFITVTDLSALDDLEYQIDDEALGRRAKRKRRGDRHTLRLSIGGTTYEASLPVSPAVLATLILGWVGLFLLALATGETNAKGAGPRTSRGAMAGTEPSRTSVTSVETDSPSSAPGRTLRTGLLTDVIAAFEKSESSGLVDLKTSEEWEIFEGWRAKLWSAGHNGTPVPNLFFVGAEPGGGVRIYRISFAGIEPLGLIKLKKVTRWHIVGVAGADDEAAADAYKRSVLPKTRW